MCTKKTAVTKVGTLRKNNQIVFLVFVFDRAVFRKLGRISFRSEKENTEGESSEFGCKKGSFPQFSRKKKKEEKSRAYPKSVPGTRGFLKKSAPLFFARL